MSYVRLSSRVPNTLCSMLLVAVLGAIAIAQPSQAADPGTTAAYSAKGAFAAAKRSGQPVEVLSQKSATTRVWANPSGHSTAEIFAVPVRLNRGGQWLDYDMTLVRRPDGTVAPKVHPEDLVLAGAKGAGDHDLATVLIKGERLGLGWRGSLPEPVLAGAQATYVDALPGVDLVVQARATGYEQFFVVKNRAAAARVASLKVVHAQAKVPSRRARTDRVCGVTPKAA